LALCLKGGLIGFALAVVTLLAIGALIGRLGSQLLPPVEIGLAQWAILAALPVAVALIGMATARIIVLRSLARLL
jgi:cell division transport system permease protein